MARFDGTDHHDRFRGTDVADEFYALGGRDSITGGAGDDTIYAGEGDDKAFGGTGDDTIYGGGGIDKLNGADGDDVLDGGDGDDALRGKAGNDSLTGGVGNDYLDGQIGHDLLFGGDGDDYLQSSGKEKPGADGDVFDGGAGNDYLFFSGAHDTTTAYIGHGGDGDDEIRFFQGGGRFEFYGDDGDDVLNPYYYTDGIADGGDGQDYLNDLKLDPADRPAGSVIDFSPLWTEGGLTIGHLTLRNIEQLGDVSCGSYFDTVSDTVIVGDMPTTALGQFRLFLGGGDDRAYGGSAVEFLDGDGGNDVISGGAGGDFIGGGPGDDELHGGVGDDTIYGDAGNDRIAGGAGIDVLIGSGFDNPANDGDDLYIFREGDTGATAETADTIKKFFDGDRISLKLIDANTGSAANDAFSFIGSAAFSGTAGELRFVDGLIEGDTDGDGVADLAIRVGGSHVLVAADFQL